MRRREFVLAAAGAALARPAAAAAATLEGDPAILDGLIAREEAAAYAYRSALASTGFAGHEADHARALRTHLAALGREGPAAPKADAELDLTARALIDAPGRPAVLDAAIALEDVLVQAYRTALRELVEPSIAQTAASILAAHAQHRALLRVEAGRDPVA